MKEYKYLFKNIGLLSLSQFATKLLAFFLVPLYTNILSTDEYGIYDLFASTICVLIPILTINIQDAVLRFALDKKTDEDAIVSISCRYLAVSNLIVIYVIFLNEAFSISELFSQYSFIFFIMFFVQSLSGVMTAYIRGIDKIAVLSISSVLTTSVTIGCNILFLVVFKYGLVGFFYANIIGPLFQCIFLIVCGNFYGHIRFRKYNYENRKMIAYSGPLIANNIAWWINNMSDRYVVTFFCGLSINGVYSVAGKIPQILNLFQSIFNQAWILSAVKEFDPEDKKGFFSNTYNLYNCMMVILCSCVIFADKILARFLYAKDFFVAWRYAPWLTIAVVFGALSGYIGGFFAAVHDSKIFASSTVYGAVTNILLNLILTPYYGAMGAAISTAISYIVVWILRLKHSRKYIRLQIRISRDIASYVGLAIQAVVVLYIDGIIGYFLQGVILISIIFLYRIELMKMTDKIIYKIK